MTFDKNGYQIRVGDTLKVFHFVGRRNKKHFMYKFVKEKALLGGKTPAFRVLHLEGDLEDGYWLLDDGKRLDGIEIVQGHGPDGTPFEERGKQHKEAGGE